MKLFYMGDLLVSKILAVSKTIRATAKDSLPQHFREEMAKKNVLKLRTLFGDDFSFSLLVN